MDQKLTNIIIQLNQQYSPQAIILYGSRATETAKDNSDWDFLIFSNQPVGEQKDIIDGERVDLIFRPILTEEETSLALHQVPLHDVKIVTDHSNGQLQTLINQSQQLFNAGPTLVSESDIIERSLSLKEGIDKLKSFQSDEENFLAVLGGLYNLVINDWYSLNRIWQSSNSGTFSEIEQQDPVFYEKLKILYQNNSREEVIEITAEIYSLLFSK